MRNRLVTNGMQYRSIINVKRLVMKFNYYYLLLCCAIALSSCKKVEDPGLTNLTDSNQTFVSTIDPTHSRFSVITLAGSIGGTAERYGFQDGAGAKARFFFPMGIDLMQDGTIYVADSWNKKIRKITPANIVSTVNIPPSQNGVEFGEPRSVKIAKDGTINILMNEGDNYKYKFWFVKPNGQVITPLKHNPDFHYFDIVRDPYNDFFWISGIRPLYQQGRLSDYRGIIEKLVLDSKETIGTGHIDIPQDSLTAGDQTTPFVSTLFCGYNKVKYTVIGKNIYKYTPSGVFTRINRDLITFTINHIVANKDSRTLYIACDNGGIYSISNGKITFLVGPNGKQDGKDGVGRAADVYALDIALSKDEGTLYFTDSNNHSVRKLLLR